MESLWQGMVVSISLNTFKMKLTVFSLRFPTKIEVLIYVRPYGRLMEAYVCFHKLKYICYKVSHVLNKLPIRFVPKIEFLINTTAIWKAYGRLWLFP